MNDDRIDWTETYKLFPGSVAYVWHAGKYSGIIESNLKECGYDIISQIIWTKPCAPIGRGDYHWKHEPCLYAVKKGSNHNWQGLRDQWTVWELQNLSAKSMQNEEGFSGHGSQKPIQCMGIPIRNNTAEGQQVYDPFLGSGTTMVAAHQLHRSCYGIELDPVYCQVIINRMLQLDPDLVITKNGEPYTV